LPKRRAFCISGGEMKHHGKESKKEKREEKKKEHKKHEGKK
jgi:hypothetical protein